MERGMCRVPIDFENGEYAGVKKDSWADELRVDNEAMTLPVPEAQHRAVDVQPVQENTNNSSQYIDITDYMNKTQGYSMEGRRPLDSPLGRNVSMDNDIERESAYKFQKGKNKANLENELEREKNRERTILTHGFSDYGFARAKAFYDGTREYHIIANGRIEEVQRWLIDEKEYVRLLISDTTPAYIKREAEWTKVFEISELERDKFIDALLSRYFKPSDAKVYNQSALKDFRARIYEQIRNVPLEVLRAEAGWFKLGNKRIYYDGTNFPQKEHMLSQLRRSCSKANISVEEILNGVCEELAVYDFGKRISFLIGYGMVTWFSDVCSVNWNKRPGIMLLGKEDVCKSYSDICLKMYARVSGSDIVELMDIDKRALTEYVDVLKDDAFVLNVNDISVGVLKFAKAIISGRSIANHGVNAPIVVLQNVPNSEISYGEYVTVDLNGFKVSEKLCFYMQELKAKLLSILEAEHVSDDDAYAFRTVSYEDAIKIVLSVIKKYLLDAGASMTILNKFFGNLEQGMMMYYQFCGNERDTLVHMLKQRFEQIIATGEVTVSGDVVKGVSRDPKYSMIVKDNAVFIPAKYLEIGIFPKIGIDRGEFRRVRDALIANGVLDIYGDKKGYTRKITIGDSRVHTYKFDISLFSSLKI